MCNEVLLTTLFTKEYLVQAKVMIDSYLNTHKQARIHVLALDEAVYNALQIIYGSTIEVTQLQLITDLYDEFTVLQTNRNFAESIFTLKAVWISHLARIQKPGVVVLYADADLYFYSPINQLYEDGWSVLLSPHYFAKHLNHLMNSGKFNAGLIAFKSDEDSLRVLASWKKSVIQNCSLSKENGNYADQKYLEGFSEISDKVKIFSNVGVNVGAWRLSKDTEVKKIGNSIFLDTHKVIAFHFHAFRIYRNHFYTGIFRYGVTRPSVFILLWIYLRYINRIEAAIRLMSDFQIEIIYRKKNWVVLLVQILRRPLELMDIWPRRNFKIRSWRISK